MNQNPLCLESIHNILTDHPWRDSILLLEETGSTNTLLKEMGSQGAPHGTVIIAERQTSGRGRLGRRFLSPGGMGIYLSILIRPDVPPAELMHLTCAVGSAMCNAVETVTGLRPGIKWTNDLVCGSRKLGGILTELSLDSKSGKVRYAVLGVGINCAQTENDFAPEIREMACSLEMVTGNPVDRNRMAAEMIRCLSAMGRQLITDKADIMEQYRGDCITLGKQISIVRGDEIRHGTALDIDSSGGLVVRFDDNTVSTVQSGEVSIRGLYGYV